MPDICHWCLGTKKDQDAVNAAAYPDHCTNCRGTGIEPEIDDEWEYDMIEEEAISLISPEDPMGIKSASKYEKEQAGFGITLQCDDSENP